MFLRIFLTIFLAELGDKTQIATLLYAASDDGSKVRVFLAASSALVLATALAVGLGSLIQEHLDPRLLSRAAGLGFIAVGAWTLLRT